MCPHDKVDMSWAIVMSVKQVQQMPCWPISRYLKESSALLRTLSKKEHQLDTVWVVSSKRRICHQYRCRTCRASYVLVDQSLAARTSLRESAVPSDKLRGELTIRRCLPYIYQGILNGLSSDSIGHRTIHVRDFPIRRCRETYCFSVLTYRGIAPPEGSQDG